MRNYDVAHLDATDVGRLKDLEDGLGACVVAYEESDTSFGGTDAGFAQLNKQQLEELQEAEQRLGAVLIAYRC